MSTPKYYPPASRAQKFSPGSFRMQGINKVLLHSTETDGWPGYGGAGGNPTLTYNPHTHQWRQHIPMTARATALMNAGSFQTNRANVVQVEIIGRAETTIPKMDDQALKDLGEFIAWMNEHYGVPIKNGVAWKPYPASYGPVNGVRLSVSKYRDYEGVLGHMHAPGNVHGDPGQLDVAKIIQYAKEAAAPPVQNGRPPVPAVEWHGKLWLIKDTKAYNKHGDPVRSYKAGKALTGYVDKDYAKSVGSFGRYFRVWKIPHRLWLPLDSRNFSHERGGKPLEED